MAYKKQYKKRNFKKTNYKKTKQMVQGQGPTLLEKIASGAGTVATLARAVAPVISMINTELKFYDQSNSASAYAVGGTPYLSCLTNNISPGTSENNRIGNSILGKNLYFRAQIGWLNSATISYGASRLIIFAWKENAQVNAPTAAKILWTPGDINSAINKDYSDQFVIIKDKTFIHNANLVTVSQQDAKYVKLYKPLDFHMRFTGSAGATQTTNHIYMLFLGGGASSANASYINLYSRFNYTDN